MQRLHFALAFIIAALISYPFIEPYLLYANEMELADPDIPEGFDGVRVAFAADLHCGQYVSVERMQYFVKEINSQKPDIILLGGDYIIDGHPDLDQCFAALSDLSAPMGVYGVLGNHEHWEDEDWSRQQLESAGITLLENDGQWISRGGDRIWVGGVGDVWEDEQDMSKMEATEDDFSIIVSHNPDFAEKLSEDTVDMILSGHTHGGQVNLFGLYAPYQTSRYGQKYMRGMVDGPRCPVYVTTGMGVGGAPIRFFARPEIAVFTLRK